MAEAFASTIIEAPVEAVWAEVRDFGALARWHPAIQSSDIEAGEAPDRVGCIRSLQLHGGGTARERLLLLDDSRYRFSYNFETPAFPVENYQASFQLIPVTRGERTFARWWASFDEPPGQAGTFSQIISRDVFATGLQSLADRAPSLQPPAGAQRWQGLRPAKVFCASVLDAPLAAVWAQIRDFTSMQHWHPQITDMQMLDGVRSDVVSGIRSFRLGGDEVREQLTLLSDSEHAMRYRILASALPVSNYHAGVRLHAISQGDRCFAVWTADWEASAEDDRRLVPMIHDDVFQRGLDGLEALLRGD